MRFLAIFLFVLLFCFCSVQVSARSVHVTVEVNTENGHQDQPKPQPKTETETENDLDLIGARQQILYVDPAYLGRPARESFLGNWHPPALLEDHAFPVSSPVSAPSDSADYALNSANDEPAAQATAETSFNLHFPGGYYSLTASNSKAALDELKSALQPIRQFLNQHKKSSIEIQVVASESRIPNYDNERSDQVKAQNPKSTQRFPLKEGELSQMRVNSLTQYLDQYFQSLYDGCDIEEKPVFLPAQTLIGTKPWIQGVSDPKDTGFTKDQYVRFTLQAKSKPEQWKCLENLKISVLYDRSPQAVCRSSHTCNRARFFVTLNNQKLMSEATAESGSERPDYADLNNEGGFHDAKYLAIRSGRDAANHAAWKRSGMSLDAFYKSKSCSECLGGSRSTTFLVDADTAKRVSQASQDGKLSLDFAYRVPYMIVNDETYPLILQSMDANIAKIEATMKKASKAGRTVLQNRLDSAKKQRAEFVADPKTQRVDSALSQPHTDVPQIKIERFMDGEYKTIFNGCPNAASGHLMTLDRCGAPVTQATGRCAAKK